MIVSTLCRTRIASSASLQAKAALGKRAVILAHHYQRADVYKHADLTGDSLKLSRLASATDAEYLVFCGVHFMAEVADILSKPEQIAILPDLAAGCSMADMASLSKVERAWRELAEVLEPDEMVTPVTYINSAADLKAFCGEHGGIVCTSSNAVKILQWSFSRREKVLFFPDQHLGRWSGHKLGIPLDEMAVWDFDEPMGGIDAGANQESQNSVMERALFRPSDVPAAAHTALSQSASRGKGDFTSRNAVSRYAKIRITWALPSTSSRPSGKRSREPAGWWVPS